MNILIIVFNIFTEQQKAVEEARSKEKERLNQFRKHVSFYVLIQFYRNNVCNMLKHINVFYVAKICDGKYFFNCRLRNGSTDLFRMLR